MKTLFKWIFGLLAVMLIAVVFACVNTAAGSGVIMMSPFILAGFSDEQSKSFSDWMTKQSEEIQTKVKGLIEAAKDGELLTELKTILKGDGKDVKGLPDMIKVMQKQLDDQNIEIQKSKINPSESVKSFAQELREKLTKEAVNLKGMTENKVKDLQIEMKSFLETATASITTGSLLPTPQFEAGVSKAPDRMPFMLDIISTGIANSLTIYWAQRKTRTDNAGFVTEGTVTTLGGGSVTQSVLGYETKSASMQNILAFIKASNNSLDDIDWLLSEIQTELLTLMALQLDAALLTGTVAVNGFDGVLTSATAFNAGGKTLAAGVVPNKYDALKFAATQIKKANFKPNYVVLNPDDVLAMELERDQDGAYLFPPYLNVQPQFAGIRIVENNGMTSGSYLIGDFSKAKFWMRKGMDLKIHDQNENDAITQLKTITLYMRGTLVIKDADKLAFVTDTFADSIAEITNT